MSDRMILICDDMPDTREAWKLELEALEEIPGEWRIELLADDFDHELQTLKERELAARKSSADQDDHGHESRFDGADILIVDYDLLSFQSSGWVSGENVAYLARCYSTCGVIVGVNLTGHENPFDLTLIDHLDSFADVNIGRTQLSNPALWGGPCEGFCPWSWPSLPTLIDRFEERIAEVGDGTPHLLDALGLTDVSLPRHARQVIEVAGNENPTFRAFALGSDLGLRGSDEPRQCSDLRDGTVARVAAARAAKWLETTVLPAQDLLIDAPHLAQRNPLLLAGDPADREAWDRTTRRDVDSGGLVTQLAKHGHLCPLWANRLLWKWASLAGDADVPGVSDPWERPPAPFVFCEDVSRFLESGHARSFIVDDLRTSLPTRYVANPNDEWVTEHVGDLAHVDYGPRTRFAL